MSNYIQLQQNLKILTILKNETFRNNIEQNSYCII